MGVAPSTAHAIDTNLFSTPWRTVALPPEARLRCADSDRSRRVAHIASFAPREVRRARLVGAALVVVSSALGLSACGSCGSGDKDKDKGSTAAAESSGEADPNGIKPFRVRWDGGRRIRPHRRGGDAAAFGP